MSEQLDLFGPDAAASPATASSPDAGAAVAAAPVPAAHRKVAARLPPGLRLGTSSWSFPGWAGIVFDRVWPEAVLARDGLAAYARHPLLRTVGVDRTYYRPMSASALGAYAAAVPGDFRFLVKADRVVTSPVDPGSRAVRGANPTFLDAGYAVREIVNPMRRGLGERAGALLFQFPPFPASAVGGGDRFLERLERFLSALPRGLLYAVELRTPALLTPRYSALLREVGAAHGYLAHPAMTPLAEQLRVARPYEQPALVVRWMLHAGLRYEAARDRYAPFDRVVDPDEATRETIARATLDALLAERDVYVVANNKAEGSAPLSLFGLAERIASWDGGGDRATGTSPHDGAPP